MEKKVIDIFSPKELEKKARLSLVVEKKEESTEEKKKIVKKNKEIKKEAKPIKKILFLIPLIFSVGLLYSYFYFSKVKLEIKPVAEYLGFEIEVVVDSTANVIDLSNKILPGKIIEKEETVSQDFPATGKFLKQTKAEGTIKIYNNYSTRTQILTSGTRFVSADGGKVFRISQTITVPGATMDKGKLVASEIDAKVVADQTGPDYNINPSTFSIPGFAGTDKYAKFYAKSFSDMTGGFSGEVSQATKEDIDKAEVIVVNKVKEKCENSLKTEIESKEITSEYIVLENSPQVEIVEKFSSAKSKDELDEFIYQAKARSKTLTFNKTELDNFVKEFVNSQIAAGKRLYEENLKIEYVLSKIDLNTGKATISLKILAEVYSYIDVSLLEIAMTGKSSNEAISFLQNQPEIVESKVLFWPFWLKKSPDDLSKIEIIMNFDIPNKEQ